jgi:hypothetical protein
VGRAIAVFPLDDFAAAGAGFGVLICGFTAGA